MLTLDGAPAVRELRLGGKLSRKRHTCSPAALGILGPVAGSTLSFGSAKSSMHGHGVLTTVQLDARFDGLQAVGRDTSNRIDSEIHQRAMPGVPDRAQILEFIEDCLDQ